MVSATELRDAPSLLTRRVLGLYEVMAVGTARSRVVEIASVFRGRVIGACAKTLLIEVSGISEELDAVEELFGDFGLVRSARSTPIAME